jgi:hypothetical protein
MPVLLPVVVMVSLWWVAMLGGRAASAQMLSTPMVVQTVPLRSRGWYQVAVDFREGNLVLCDDSNVVFCASVQTAFNSIHMNNAMGLINRVNHDVTYHKREPRCST